MSDDDDPLSMPIAHVSKVTAVWDARVSIIDDLLGGPLDLAPSAASELALAPADPQLLIRPSVGAECVRVGWTVEQLVASLGEPQSIADARLDDLDEEQLELLKRDFRRALRLCHPDQATPRLQEKAVRVSRALITAYRANDLLAVQDMLLQLETEGLEGTKPQDASSRELLEKRLHTVRQRVVAERRRAEELEASPAYKKAAGLEDWDAYFAAAKARLQERVEAKA